MFSYKFIIDTARNNALRLRLTNNRKKVEVSVGVCLTPADLENAMSDKPKPQNLKWKSLLMNYTMKLDELKCELLKSGRFDEDVKVIRDMVLKECMGREVKKTEVVPTETLGQFVTHFQSFINGKTNKGTRGVYRHTLDRIRLFDPDVDKKSFEDIDLKWLTAFESFCARTASKNARNIHLRNIRAVFNNAIDYEITAVYPFRRFKIRPEATRKRSLSVEELREFIGMEVEEYQQFYKDMFLLSFYLIGINAADLAKLTDITSDGRIEYDRAKTHRKYSIKVEPEAMEIIKKYQGANGLLCISDRWSDHRNFLHQFNKALKNMGEVVRVGRGGRKVRTPAFPRLSSYWCRHTWATIAYNCCGVSEDVIAQALGHASSHTTTSIYINRSVKLVDEANRKVIDYVFNKV